MSEEKQKKEREPWKFHDSRWQIKAQLFTDSPLYIGSGDTFAHSELKNELTGKPIQINACIKDVNGKPYLPATTIKGKLSAWLKARVSEKELSDLFGTESDKNNSGNGGCAEFHNALLKKSLETDGKNYPYWNPDSQTYIEVGIAINRHTRTVDHRKLFHSEAVPPNVGFEVIITGMMTDTQAGLLISALQAFPDKSTDAKVKPERAEVLKAEPTTHEFNSAATFGADDTSGKGRMYLSGKVAVKKMDKTQVCNWLNSATQGMAEQDFIELNKEDIAKLTALIKPFKQREVLSLTIQMDGAFLINNPEVSAKKDTIKDKNDKEPDQQPLKDAKGKPLLTGKALRGALRSQAEKIMRTLDIHCCDTTKPCDSIYKKENAKKLCPVCQVFGATGWQSPLHIHPFNYVQPDIEQGLKTQNFVAIDRFHGGGKHSALFNTSFALKPCFKGAIELDDRLPDWGKGLLALVLRDLHEGDIKLGFGANKGYGGVEKITLDKAFSDEEVKAFRTHFNIQYEPHLNTISKADEQALPPANPSTTGFHNPYHFIPVKEPKTDTWLNRDDLNTANNPHSHALYKKQRHHGRIHCILTAETQFFIGAEKLTPNIHPAKVENYRFNGELAIPATSLRGMISSLAESASNSALRVLDNGLLSYRKPVEQALKEIGIVIKQNNQFKLIPMKKIELKNAYTNPDMAQFIQENKTWTPDAPKIFYVEMGAKEITSENLPKAATDLTIARKKNNMQPGILRILGKDSREDEMPTKRHEWFIPVTEKFIEDGFIEYSKTAKSTYRITDEALAQFKQLADQRTESQKNKELSEQEWLPYHLKGMVRETDHKLPIKAGDLVYYRLNSNNEVEELSFSAIWRRRVEDDQHQAAKVFNFFPRNLCNLLPFNKERNSLSPAELLFGFIEGEDKDGNKPKDALAFAGKVRINTGQLVNPKNENTEQFLDKPVTLKILASPKLPSPALYFRHQNAQNTHIAKHDLTPEKHQAKGRKQYLHALRRNDGTVQKLSSTGNIANGGDALFPWQTRNDKEHIEQKVNITPIRQGTQFKFTVDFDNLSDYELGLLCYALRPSKAFRHKLGMGKPLGLGTVKIAMTKLEFIDRHKRYAKETLNATRYNAQTLDMKSFMKNLRNNFIQTMDKDTLQALELLGNPDNINAPVHYPQMQNKDIEQETYQWFVENDKQGKQQLNPLTQDSTQLPTLKRSIT